MSGHLYTGTKSIANYLCVILLLILSGSIKLNPALSPNSCFRDVNQTKITDQLARRIFNEIRRCHLCPTNKTSCVFVGT